MVTEIRKYKIVVRHDKGTHIIRTRASSEESARKIVMANEGCPESAIKKVTVGKTVFKIGV